MTVIEAAYLAPLLGCPGIKDARRRHPQSFGYQVAVRVDVLLRELEQFALLSLCRSHCEDIPDHPRKADGDGQTIIES
jgi:hypothetical protein